MAGLVVVDGSNYGSGESDDRPYGVGGERIHHNLCAGQVIWWSNDVRGLVCHGDANNEAAILSTLNKVKKHCEKCRQMNSCSDEQAEKLIANFKEKKKWQEAKNLEAR